MGIRRNRFYILILRRNLIFTKLPIGQTKLGAGREWVKSRFVIVKTDNKTINNFVTKLFIKILLIPYYNWPVLWHFQKQLKIKNIIMASRS